MRDLIPNYWEEPTTRSTLDHRGAAMVSPGFNSTNDTMEGYAEVYRAMGYRVHRVLLTQNPQAVQKMTDSAISDATKHYIEATCNGVGQNDERIGMFHSFPGIAHAHSEATSGPSLDKTVELATPYQLNPRWHRWAGRLGKIPMLHSLLRFIPQKSWNEHAPAEDPHASRRAHSSMPTSAYYALFRIYNAVRSRKSSLNATRMWVVDPNDELLDVDGSKKFLEGSPSNPLQKLKRIFRRRQRGQLYHHNLDRESMSSSEWEQMVTDMKDFLGVTD